MLFAVQQGCHPAAVTVLLHMVTLQHLCHMVAIVPRLVLAADNAPGTRQRAAGKG